MSTELNDSKLVVLIRVKDFKENENNYSFLWKIDLFLEFGWNHGNYSRPIRDGSFLYLSSEEPWHKLISFCQIMIRSEKHDQSNT